jgi:predicted NACHT family NTPase
MELDLLGGVRSFLKDTIFAHPDDIKEAEKKKSLKKKKSPKKKKGQ